MDVRMWTSNLTRMLANQGDLGGHLSANLRHGVRHLWLFALMAILAGCGLVNVPIEIPTDKKPRIMGSVSETGRVTMGSPYLYLEDPKVDWAEARRMAVEHCAKMGYAGGAEPIGKTRKECDGKIGTDCPRWAILGDYQCLR